MSNIILRNTFYKILYYILLYTDHIESIFKQRKYYQYFRNGFAMTKQLSIEINEELYAECEAHAKELDLPVEKYIIQSLSLYNKINKRKSMIKDYTKRPAEHSSSEIIRELSKLQDSRMIL